MAASSSASNGSLTPNLVEKYVAISGNSRPCSIEDADVCACDSFCQNLQIDIACDRNRPSKRGHGSILHRTRSAPTRKAEREKLRRDRLNEMLLELAGAVGEPDRPKYDKSAILGDAIHALKELMADVEQLQAKNLSLADESKDLFQEKKDLDEERQLLISKVQWLKSQAHQHMHAMLLWMTADPAAMMGAHAANVQSSHSAMEVDAHARSPQIQVPFKGLQPMRPVPAPMAVHPGLQAYSRYSDWSTPYFPFPFSFDFKDSAPLQTDEFCAQIPHRYPPQGQQVMTHQMSAVAQAAHHSQACGSQYPFLVKAVPDNQNTIDATRMSTGDFFGHNPGSNCLEPMRKEHRMNM